MSARRHKQRKRSRKIAPSIPFAISGVCSVGRHHPSGYVADNLYRCGRFELCSCCGSPLVDLGGGKDLPPGVKADCCLILERHPRQQEVNSIEDIGGVVLHRRTRGLRQQRLRAANAGVWIIELSELDSPGRAEVSRIKAFMSRTTDRFRPPYGKRLIESPRQCVFAGSVNHSSYLRDDTGGRRFWPVACGRIDIDFLGPRPGPTVGGCENSI
jgi:hypothetical protein